MGHVWEVEEWRITEYGFRWVVAYAGDSKRDADDAVGAARDRGVGAIRTTWRPTT